MLRIVYERGAGTSIRISLNYVESKEADCGCCMFEDWTFLDEETAKDENHVLEAVALLLGNIPVDTCGLGPYPNFRVAR